MGSQNLGLKLVSTSNGAVWPQERYLTHWAPGFLICNRKLQTESAPKVTGGPQDAGPLGTIPGTQEPCGKDVLLLFQETQVPRFSSSAFVVGNVFISG